VNPIKKDLNTYDIEVYNHIAEHEYDICGQVKRVPHSPEDSELRRWMFYPSRFTTLPISNGDLSRIWKFMAELNIS